MEEQTSPDGYGIGAVTRLTGLPAHTLRIWERRYGAVTARRSQGGRRLYSDGDVARLLLLKQLSDRGERIGRIATLSDSVLRGRLDKHAGHLAQRAQGSTRRRIAVLGEMLPAKLADGLANCDLVTAATDQAVFRADVRRLRPDVLIVEQAALDLQTDQLIGELRGMSGAERVILVFGFGRQRDIARLSSDNTIVVRAPVEPDELSTLVQSISRGHEVARPPEAGVAHTAPIQAIAPRRYSAAELARLRAVNGTVDCECPIQIVDLVTSLSAFEVYSAQCESRTPQDAALHAALHRTTAAARALMEEALTQVAKAEGLL
jgi:DNA-binding transcriptional MerR regulator